MTQPERYDVVVIGAGPAGQKAAVTAADAGRRVLVIEKSRNVGGECVYHGTIPSKTIRETALYLSGLERRAVGVGGTRVGPETMVKSLMGRLDQVLANYGRQIAQQTRETGAEVLHGRARLAGANEIDVTHPDGTSARIVADVIVVATGSRPRKPPGIPIDHEHILDSDSLLSLIYLPHSMVVLGAGVIACEFASIFQSLGVHVTIVDGGKRPMAFLDEELVERFVAAFEADGGRYVPGNKPADVYHDGLGTVHTTLSSGEVLQSQKTLVALGRTASVGGLAVENAGLDLTERGFLAVDDVGRTSVPSIYAVGDVIGPPALAASAMNQGRRAVRHALGLDLGTPPELIPVGIYTVPEMASVGSTEDQVTSQYGGCIVGRCQFDAIARGQINGAQDGLLKLVTCPQGRRVFGAQIVGEGATELVHMAQMALIGQVPVDAFVDNVFNFPTFAEAYRIAALDVVAQRAQGLRRAS
ncbi:MAG: Si-specific NAD(P)(+) transhydrogenase [bacterium]|nr:Si-specific NAD(P)(+) transhydrogenase [bacterium]